MVHSRRLLYQFGHCFFHMSYNSSRLLENEQLLSPHVCDKGRLDVRRPLFINDPNAGYAQRFVKLQLVFRRSRAFSLRTDPSVASLWVI